MPPTESRFDDPKYHEKWIDLLQSLNPDIDPDSFRLMNEMRMTSRAMYHIGKSSVTASGLTYAQYGVLMHLFFAERVGERDELNPSEISERHGTSRNTVSSLIRSLEEQELVERSLDKQDRRKFNIRLTSDGRTLVETHIRQHFQIIGQCFTAFSADEKESLSRLLGKLRQTAVSLK